LAGSLSNQSNRLSGLGRREEALTAIEEATNIYRTLADAYPAVFLSDLARCRILNAWISLEDGDTGSATSAALEGLGIAVDRQLQDLTSTAAHFLRQAYQQDSQTVTHSWRALTRTEPPGWLRE
ncbi:hypothetical protein, partial [Herbidospora cretacea]|uniref:hypothetical protein n=1 Tax=Herbidospora cretacea TaxID=28444 RepID=UPI001C3F1856